jgi:hypothetical protein
MTHGHRCTTLLPFSAGRGGLTTVNVGEPGGWWLAAGRTPTWASRASQSALLQLHQGS